MRLRERGSEKKWRKRKVEVLTFAGTDECLLSPSRITSFSDVAIGPLKAALQAR